MRGPYDLAATLTPLAPGPFDPTLRSWPNGMEGATRTPHGPGAWRAERIAGERLRVVAWGPGAEWLLENAADRLGLADEDVGPPIHADPAVRRAALRAAGVRLPRTHRVVEALATNVLAQRVSGKEAARAHDHLVRRFSDRAPGPTSGLWLPLSPDQLANLPGWAFAPLGVPVAQGDLLRMIGERARRLEETDGLGLDEAARRLTSIPGIGPWTAGQVLLHAMGHPDALPLGDFHLPSIVAWNLAGERRADDRRMLELLEPYRGQRGRVARWITAAGGHPPRRAPRSPLRPLPDGWRAAARRPR